jgi:hypothetical protein
MIFVTGESDEEEVDLTKRTERAAATEDMEYEVGNVCQHIIHSNSALQLRASTKHNPVKFNETGAPHPLL